jgi:succinate dehydrogenase/fumarate reductase flavoprotein subunit
MGEKGMKKDLTRRGFIKGAALGAGAMAVAGLGGATDANAVPPPKRWDMEADVVVVGFGAGGSAAAIEAHDAGAKVLIVEKMKEGLEGGDTGISGGLLYLDTKTNIDSWRKKSFGTVEEEFLRCFSDNVKEVNTWLRGMGLVIDGAKPGMGIVKSPVRGASSGHILFAFLKEQVKKRGIQVLYGTAGKDLIQDPATREILGVRAGAEGRYRNIKARKAVVLTTGSYESNPEMLTDFGYPGVYVASEGSPANTGDGLKMAVKAGAHMRHMMPLAIEWGEFALKAPSQAYKTSFSMDFLTHGGGHSHNYIFVDRKGKRFMNERLMMVHQKETLEVLHFDFKAIDYPHIPFFIVFDETMRKSGRVVKDPELWGWRTTKKVYEWSADNSAEIEKGWIVKADTIQDLAGKMKAVDWQGKAIGVETAGLVDTVSKFNEFCEAGKDLQYDRPKASLLALKTPPFYAAELCFNCIYTLGGLKNNCKAQTVDGENKPIPRLYSAGNVGGSGIVSPGAIPEAIAFGRLAGKNAAAERPWGKKKR